MHLEVVWNSDCYAHQMELIGWRSIGSKWKDLRKSDPVMTSDKSRDARTSGVQELDQPLPRKRLRVQPWKILAAPAASMNKVSHECNQHG